MKDVQMNEPPPSRSDHSVSNSDASNNDEDEKVDAAEGDSDSGHSMNDFEVAVEVEKSAATKVLVKIDAQDEIQI